MTSPLRQKLRTLIPDSGHGQQDFETQTGINIETDIDHVLATITEQATPAADCRALRWCWRAAGSTW